MRELVINISAACCGNPGLAGMGGIITDKTNNEILYTFSFSKENSTLYEGQYLALLKALLWTVNLKEEVSIVLIKSDSHLVTCQLKREFVVLNENVIPLHVKAMELFKRLNCQIDVVWVPYEKNITAAAMAFRGAAMPFALVEEDSIIPLPDNYYSVSDAEKLNGLPPVNPETVKAINILNEANEINTSNIFSLLSSGIDKYSRAKPESLLKYIGIRFGETTKDYLFRTLSDLNSYYSKNVLRWAARGLRPDLAFVKSRMETEIKEEDAK